MQNVVLPLFLDIVILKKLSHDYVQIVFMFCIIQIVMDLENAEITDVLIL